MNEEEIVKRLDENTAALREVHQLSLRTARYVKWLRIMDIVKLVLILIPLVAAYLYLPQFLNAFTSGYGQLVPNIFK